MKLDEYIALLEAIRAAHGGQIEVVGHDDEMGNWYFAGAPKVVENDRTLQPDLGLDRAVQVGP